MLCQGSLGSTRRSTVRLDSVRQSAFVKVRSVQASISYGSLGTKRRRGVRYVAFCYRWVSFGQAVLVCRFAERHLKVRYVALNAWQLRHVMLALVQVR